jgi:hypothetical protein
MWTLADLVKGGRSRLSFPFQGRSRSCAEQVLGFAPGDQVMMRMKEGFPVATTRAPGIYGVDWENRVDFDRLREYRLARVREQLEVPPCAGQVFRPAAGGPDKCSAVVLSKEGRGRGRLTPLDDRWRGSPSRSRIYARTSWSAARPATSAAALEWYEDRTTRFR